ncbi:uncharacterized protein LOC143464526 [Clavelina lepadiformis]|uniref:uncharacterized protein LOC143464526 n=1 Tax=Clavelina lepadiformis TaxID=159417 RepID=UPI004042FD94
MKIISLCGVFVLLCCVVDAWVPLPGFLGFRGFRGFPRGFTGFTCKRPSDPANGKFTPLKSKYSVGQNITYSCDTGFKLSSSNNKRRCFVTKFVPGPPSCVDRDECRSRPCHPDANCRNTRGSFTCRCKSGYSGNGFQCRVRNSCASNPCHPDADCTNTDAGFECECKAGYTGDGTTCTDVNECSSKPCHNRATCTNSPGSYSCKCRNGYTGDGAQCSDINECQAQPCDANAGCINTPGRYVCSCNRGYRGNGRTCTKLAECPTPDVDIPDGRVENNRFGGSYYEGELVRVVCDVNYKLSEFGSLAKFDRYIYRCGSDGKWTGRLPECTGTCLHACRGFPSFANNAGLTMSTPSCGCEVSCKDDESCCEDYDRYCNRP